jgi:hypothetical protein
MLASLVGLGLLLAAGTSQAQPGNPGLFSANSTPLGDNAPLIFDKQPNPPSRDFQRASYQIPGPPESAYPANNYKEQKVDPPGPSEIFGHLDSEKGLERRLQQKQLDDNRKVEDFPSQPPFSREMYAGRYWAPSRSLVEPNYVSYDRMYFEDINSERYGWDLGLLQPVVSAGVFLADFALVPYRFFSEPCRCHESNAGYCLPGDAVPYILYPIGASATGAMGETAAILGLIALFP